MAKKQKRSLASLSKTLRQRRLADLSQTVTSLIGERAAADTLRVRGAGGVETVTPLVEGFSATVSDSESGSLQVFGTVDRTGGVRISCTCGRAPCGHFGAAMIAWGDLFAERVLRGELPEFGLPHPVPRRQQAPAAGSLPTANADRGPVTFVPGMPLAVLRPFAELHGIRPDVDRAVRHVAPELRLRGSAAWLAGYDTRTVGELIAVVDVRSREMREVQTALCEWLGKRVTRRSENTTAEAARVRGRVKPSDPRAARIFLALEAERVRLRDALPALDADGPSGYLDLVTEPPTIQYHAGTERGCHGPHGEGLGTIRLHGPDSPVVLTVRCSCTAPKPEGCEVRLATVEAALGLLCAPAESREREELLLATALPDWERTLRALDRSLDVQQPEVEGQIAFVVERVPAVRVRLALLTVGKRGALKLKKVARKGLESAPLTPVEQHVVDLLHPGTRHDVADQSHEAAARALDRLVGHPRVFLADGPKTPIPVEREDVTLAATRGPDGSILLRVKMAGETKSPAAASLQLLRASDGLLLWFSPALDRCVVLHVPAAITRVVHELASRPDVLPKEATPALLDRLPRLAERCGVSVDPSLRGREVPAQTTPHVRLSLTADGHLDVLVRVRALPTAAAVVPGLGFPEVFVHSDEGTVCAVRDLSAERAAARELAGRLSLHEDGEEGPFTWGLPPSDLALEVIEASQSLRDVDVLWADERRPQITSAGARQLAVKVGTTASWLALGGELRTDSGGVPLEELLAALRDERRFVKVGDRVWVRIEEALRQLLEPAAHLAREQHGESMLPTLAAPLVDALREGGADVDGGSSWVELVERMRTADRTEHAIPATLKADLRPYQVAGVRWMLRLAGWARGACLADDMGLGKTVQALAVMLERAQRGPTLVVAPTSVGFNWVREAERFAPSLRVVAFRGRDSLDMLEDVEEGSVVVTSYDLLARYDEPLGAIPWVTLVLDEAQAIKNPSTRRARAVFGIEAELVLALTGTPVENHTGELWSVFRAIAPGLLGSLDDFQKRFAVPIERFRDAKARRALAYLARPFVLRRLKADVAPELPPRTDVRVDVELSAGERRLYDAMRAAAVDALTGVDPSASQGERRFQILAALTRLRQLACHPRLVDPNASVSSSKLRVLREIVSELRDGGHRALVFSQFTSLLAIVRAALAEDGARLRYLDGSTPAAQRREEVDAFQRGEADVFLLSLKAGGTGLNLTAADYVIHLDPWWNPAVEDQATDRAHRIGQDSPVTVIRLVATGTVEEGILALHAEKRELVGALLDGTGAAAAMSLDEMMALLTAGATGMVDEDEEGTPEADEPARDARSVVPDDRTASAIGAPERASISPAAGAVARPRAGRRKSAIPKAKAAIGGARAGAAATADVPRGDLSASWEAALQALDACLLRARQNKDLKKATSASGYARVAKRLAAFAVSAGHDCNEESLGGLVEAYKKAVRQNRDLAPESDLVMLSAVTKWLSIALDQR